MTTRRAKDQIVGKTSAAGLRPAVNGIAGRRLAGLTARAMGVADAIGSIIAARDSGDPTSEAIAAKLLENKEFIRSMIAACEQIKAEIPAAAAAKDEPASETPAGTPNGNGLEEDPTSANHQKARGSGLPGADSRNAPGSYTVAHLQSDLATQNSAVVQLAAKSGMDSARAAVAANPLIPAWDSNVWSPDARQAFKDRASYDGVAAEHLRRFGALPSHVRESDAAKVSGLYDLHGSQAEPERSPRFFDR